MVESNSNSRGNLYMNKYAKTMTEKIEGNTLGIIDNEIKMKGFKFEELSDWNIIKGENSRKSNNEEKRNQPILKAEEVYSPIIKNEDLFQNKAFRSNKDNLSNTITKEEQSNSYSVNTSMFTYQNNMNNCDKIDLSIGNNTKMNLRSNIPPEKSKTRRYKGGGGDSNNNQQGLQKQMSNYNVINPIQEEESPKKRSPIELLDKSNNYIHNKESKGDYDEIEEQLMKAKQLIADLEKDANDIDSDSLNNGSDQEEKEKPNEINDLSILNQPNNRQPITTVPTTKGNEPIQSIAQDSKEKNIGKPEEKPYILKELEKESNKLKMKAQAKLIQEQKQKEKSKIEVKIIDKSSDKIQPMSSKPNISTPSTVIPSTNINTNNYNPLSIENHQYTTNVMLPYQNMDITSYAIQQQQLQMQYQQQIYNQQIIDYTNQIQYQQQQQYLLYQQQQQQMNPYQYYPYPMMNMPPQYPPGNIPISTVDTKPVPKQAKDSNLKHKKPKETAVPIEINNYPKSTPTPTPTPRIPSSSITKANQVNPKQDIKSKELLKAKDKEQPEESIRQPPQVNPSKTGTGYNHIQQIKNIKQQTTPSQNTKTIPKKKPKKQSVIEEPQQHNKIYTTMKQPLPINKKPINKDRVTSAKMTNNNPQNINMSLNNSNINNNTNPLDPNDQMKDLNELLNNHMKYNEQVAKIKETLHD